MKSNIRNIIMAILLLIFIIGGYNYWNNQKNDSGLANNTTPEEMINKAIAFMQNANSFEYKVYLEDSTTFGNKKSGSQSNTEQTLIFEPFTMWTKTDTLMTNISNEKSRMVSEVYQAVQDNKMDFNLRYSHQEGSDLGKDIDLSDWEKKSYTEKEQIDLMVKMNRSVFDSEFYLLSSNIDSFRLAEDAAAKKQNLLRFDGSIEPITVLEAYKKYLRYCYVQMKIVVDSENLSLEDLKNEITSGERPELQTGIPKLAYSETPIPISLWIDKDTITLKKIMIDEKSIMQTLMEKEVPKFNQKLEAPVVTKSLLTYEIKSIDKSKEISMPE